MWPPPANNRDFLQRASRFGTMRAMVRAALHPQHPRRPDLPGARPPHRAQLYRRRLALLADRIPHPLRRPRRADPAEFEEKAGEVVGSGELELGPENNCLTIALGCDFSKISLLISFVEIIENNFIDRIVSMFNLERGAA